MLRSFFVHDPSFRQASRKKGDAGESCGVLNPRMDFFNQDVLVRDVCPRQHDLGQHAVAAERKQALLDVA